MTRQALVALLVSLGASTLTAAQASAYITTSDGSTVLALGDIVTFQIIINPKGESLTGFEFYLTIDPAVLKPLLTADQINDTTIVYKPFTRGNLPGGTDLNNTHGDEWSDDPYVDLNGLSGFQLDYMQQTGVTNPTTGKRETFNWSGTGATFQAVVIGLPSDPSGQTTITFDRGATHYMEQRVNRYWLEVGDGINMATTDGVFDIGGVRISPALPDTILAPGDTWREYLPGHFASSLYVDGAWSLNPEYIPGGTSAYIDPADTSLVVTSLATTHDSITFTLRLEEQVDWHYYDEQRIKVTVDYPPVFTAPLPAQPLTYDEDDSLKVAAAAIFTDDDDPGPDISVWLEPGSPIRVNYDGGAGTIAFSADTNYFSVAPYDSARLFIADGLGVTIDSLLRFTVNPVNDPPVVNFDSVSALGDTLVIHRNVPDTLDLKLFVTDVDDPVLTWSVNNPDPANLPTATILSGNLLKLLAADNAAYVDIDLIITATDDEGASDSDTLVVSIRSWPPDIIVVEDIKINSQGTPPAKGLDLTQWVTDLDTPLDQMTWSFRAVDAVTGAIDSRVIFKPGNTFTGDTVNISVTQTYAAVDLLEMTVTDDAYNTDIDTARLFIFDDDGPMIFPLPGLTVYRDTTYAGIIDLDDYVADLQDEPEEIDWASFGGDSLASFYIDPYSHEVTIKTNTTFIGNLIVSLVATNSRGLTDTSGLAILVARRVDGPPVWYAVPDEVEVVFGWTTDLFTYGEICYDETPTDQIIFTPYYEEDSLFVKEPALTDSVKLETPISDKKYTTQLYFSAEDEFGQTSNSGTITVNVKDSFSPVWDPIPNIHLNVGETYSGLFLRDYVSDRDTPDNDLTIEVVNVNPYIEVSYDPITTELTVSAGSRTSDSRLIITATDDKGNTATTLLHVIVRSVYDDIPPEGELTYFFNPVADKWIHYVLVADGTTTWFNTTYTFNSQEMDLEFTQRDGLPGTGTLIWFAPFHFEYAGTYHLSAVLADDADPANNLQLALSLGVSFSKAMGDVLASPDRRLTVSYPAAPIPAGKLLIIAEDSMPELTGAPRGGYAQGPGTAEIARTGANKGNDTPVPATLYSLDTNLPEPILVTLTYHQNRDADPYYSFYEVDGDQLRKIETYTGADGQFEAAVTLGRDVIFASSDTPARNAPLPDAELFCYPNPFNSTIQVRFLLRREDRGRIVIYNLLGREVYASPRQPFGLGVHAFSWHGIDSRGLLVPSGAYFIRLETDGGKVVTRKVTLLK